MCGRFTLTTAGELVEEVFGLDDTPELKPRYNIAPTQPVAVIRRRRRDGLRVLEEKRWGLLPPGEGAPPPSPLINARSETVGERPAFRAAFRYRRCLVPADGFFEWRKESGVRQPYLIRLPHGAPFAMAGIWERGGDETPSSCAILTTEANEMMREIHDRMPVILPAEAIDVWLESGPEDLAPLLPLLVPYPADGMTRVAVDRRVNDVRNDDAACLEPPKGQRSLFDGPMLE